MKIGATNIRTDFIFSNNSKIKYSIYPIEVKSSNRYSITPRLRFREKYRSRTGGCYIIHTKNFMAKEDIVCIPPYMVMCL